MIIAMMTGEADTWTYRDIHLGAEKAAEYEAAYTSGYYADEWAWFERPYLAHELSRVRREGGVDAADVACGTGRVLGVSERLFPTAFGFDISPQMLEVARRACPHAHLAAVDITSGGFDQRFDVVTAFRFFLNAEDALRRAGAAAMFAMLRPGGTLVVNTHTQPWSPLGTTKVVRRAKGTHLRTLSARSLSRLLTQAGFEVDAVTYHGLVPRVGEWYPRWYRTVHRWVETRRVPRLLRPFTQSAIVVAHRPR